MSCHLSFTPSITSNNADITVGNNKVNVKATIDTRMFTVAGRNEIKEEFKAAGLLLDTVAQLGDASVSFIGDKANGETGFFQALENKMALKAAAEKFSSNSDNAEYIKTLKNSNATSEEKQIALQAFHQVIANEMGIPVSQVAIIIDMAAKKLIKEAIEQGIKISPEKIVSIAKVDGKIVFLEKGRHVGAKGSHNGVGLEHIIVEHGDDFLRKGILESQISQTVMRAVRENNIVGTSSMGTVYRTLANVKPINIAIGVGDNGFIVRASPITKFKPIQ